MPYLLCSDCGLTTYSARLWVNTPHCPRCGHELPIAARARLLSRADRPPAADRTATTTHAVALDRAIVIGRPSLMSAVVEALRRMARLDARKTRR
jgi:hypothetical protein